MPILIAVVHWAILDNISALPLDSKSDMMASM